MTALFSKVFERDNQRCVYCGKYMLFDFETFYTSQIDHLIPGAGDDKKNLVLSCYVCNSLKGKHRLSTEYESKSRKEYIQEMRAYIMGQRSK